MNTKATDKILARLDKYKYGLFVMIVFFVLSLVIRVQYGFVERPDLSDILHRKMDDVIELKLEPIEMVEERMSFDQSDIRNLTRNENSNETSGGSPYDYPQQSYYKNQSIHDIERGVYDLEKTFFDEAGGSQTRASIQREIEQRKEQQQENAQDISTRSTTNSTTKSVGNATKGNVLVSYDLKGRTGQYVPAPGYMCPQGTSGKVIVKIKVDTQGKVLDAKASSSSSSNECMVSYALEFARKSKFNYVSEGQVQEGTITYTFVN